MILLKTTDRYTHISFILTQLPQRKTKHLRLFLLQFSKALFEALIFGGALIWRKFAFTQGLFIFTCVPCYLPQVFHVGKQSPWSYHGVWFVMLMDPKSGDNFYEYGWKCN